MMQEMFKDMPISSSIISIIILATVFFLIDATASKPQAFEGNVIDKYYKAESYNTGTGIGVTSSGKAGVVMTSERESEKFILMVKTKNKKIVTVNCEPELYYKKKIGELIEYNAYKGFFTGIVWVFLGVR